MNVGILPFIVMIKQAHILHALMALMLIGVDVVKLENPRDTDDIAWVYPFAGWCPEDLRDPPVPETCKLPQP